MEAKLILIASLTALLPQPSLEGDDQTADYQQFCASLLLMCLCCFQKFSDFCKPRHITCTGWPLHVLRHLLGLGEKGRGGGGGQFVSLPSHAAPTWLKLHGSEAEHQTCPAFFRRMLSVRAGSHRVIAVSYARPAFVGLGSFQWASNVGLLCCPISKHACLVQSKASSACRGAIDSQHGTFEGHAQNWQSMVRYLHVLVCTCCMTAA